MTDQNLKFKIPKKITIGNQDFRVVQNKNQAGGWFDCQESVIGIGTRDIKTCPDRVFDFLVHEISEIIHVNVVLTRYNDHSAGDDYKFFMNHKQFQTHNSILSHVILNQILK